MLLFLLMYLLVVLLSFFIVFVREFLGDVERFEPYGLGYGYEKNEKEIII